MQLSAYRLILNGLICKRFVLNRFIILFMLNKNCDANCIVSKMKTCIKLYN